jgi:hypothetical protein
MVEPEQGPKALSFSVNLFCSQKRQTRTIPSLARGNLIALAFLCGCHRTSTPQFHPLVGWRYSYSVKLDSAVRAEVIYQTEGATRPTVMPSNIEVHLAGTFVFDVVQRSSRGFIVLVHATDATVRLMPEDAGRAAVGKALVEDLRKPTELDFSDNGSIRHLRYSPNLNSSSQTLLRLLLDSFQCSFASEQGTSKWTVIENDPVGRCRVNYNLVGNGVLRTKVGYALILGSGASQGIHQTPLVSVGGSMTYRFDENKGLFTSAEGKLSEVASLASADHSTADTSFYLSNDMTEEQSTAVKTEVSRELETLLRVDWLPLYAIPDADKVQRQAYNRDLKGGTLPDILLQIARKERSGEPGSTTSLLFKQLVARLYLHPEDLPVIEQVLSGAPDGSLRMQWVCMALSIVGTESAQKALIDELGSRRQGPSTKGDLIFYLSRVARPSHATSQWLAQVSSSRVDPMAHSATLALGALISNLAPLDAESADRLTLSLCHRLNGATTYDEKLILLGAIGNAGQMSSVDTVEPFMKSDKPALRAKAYQAVRMVEGERVDLLLLQGMADRESFVRLSAVDACHDRNSGAEVVSRLQAIVEGDSSVENRLTAVNILWIQRAGIPGLQDWMSRVATNNNNFEVRKKAASFLELGVRS